MTIIIIINIYFLYKIKPTKSINTTSLHNSDIISECPTTPYPTPRDEYSTENELEFVNLDINKQDYNT